MFLPQELDHKVVGHLVLCSEDILCGIFCMSLLISAIRPAACVDSRHLLHNRARTHGRRRTPRSQPRPDGGKKVKPFCQS